MKLNKLIDQYVAHRRSLGEKFQTNERMLYSFCRAIGNIDVREVSSKKVAAFIQGKGPVTSAWHIRFNTLKGFYSYAVSRDYVATSPLPKIIPQHPPSFIPYIYSHDELRKLLKTTKCYQRNRCLTDPMAVRTILLVLYGTGLRVGEVLNLNNSDVNFPDSTLRIHNTKFFKTRIVPFGDQVRCALKCYSRHRSASKVFRQENTPFFTTYTEKRLNQYTLENTFRRICTHAGVRRLDGARYQPRLHDLRHTFAVHRLTSWYHEGKDVQRLLPQLSVYLGHAHLAATQVYLSMTPELMEAANKRFERYMNGEKIL